MRKSGLGHVFVVFVLLSHCTNVCHTISVFQQPEDVRSILNTMDNKDVSNFNNVMERAIQKMQQDPSKAMEANPMLAPVLNQLQQARDFLEAHSAEQATAMAAATLAQATAGQPQQAPQQQLEQAQAQAQAQAPPQAQAPVPVPVPAPSQAQAQAQVDAQALVAGLAQGDGSLSSAATALQEAINPILAQLSNTNDNLNNARLMFAFFTFVLQLTVDSKILIADYKDTVRGMSNVEAHAKFGVLTKRLWYFLKGSSDSSGFIGVLSNSVIMLSFLLMDMLGPSDPNNTRQSIGVGINATTFSYYLLKFITMLRSSHKALSRVTWAFLVTDILVICITLFGFNWGLGMDESGWTKGITSIGLILIAAHGVIAAIRIVSPTVDAIRGGHLAPELAMVGITRHLTYAADSKLHSISHTPSHHLVARAGEKLELTAECENICKAISVKVTLPDDSEKDDMVLVSGSAHDLLTEDETKSGTAKLLFTVTNEGDTEATQEFILDIKESLSKKKYTEVKIGEDAHDTDTEYPNSDPIVVSAKCAEPEHTGASCSGFHLEVDGRRIVDSVFSDSYHRATIPQGTIQEGKSVQIVRMAPAAMDSAEHAFYKSAANVAENNNPIKTEAVVQAQVAVGPKISAIKVGDNKYTPFGEGRDGKLEEMEEEFKIEVLLTEGGDANVETTIEEETQKGTTREMKAGQTVTITVKPANGGIPLVYTLTTSSE